MTKKATVKVSVSNETTTKGDVVEMVNTEMKMPEVIAVAKEVGVQFVVGMTKAQLVRDINAVVGSAAVTAEAPATGETPVAEKTKEVVEMTPEQMLKEIQLKKNQKAWDRVSTDAVLDITEKEKYVNKNRVNLINSIHQKAVKFVDDLGELNIRVLGFSWYLDAHNNLAPKGKKGNQYGLLQIQVEPGVLEYKVWHPAPVKKFVWEDFASYTADATHGIIFDLFNPVRASEGFEGVLTMPIYHSDAMGGFFVMLPGAPAKDGGIQDMFRTKDHSKKEYVITELQEDGSVKETVVSPFKTVNNGRVNAALTAYLRMTQSQFIQANPMNDYTWNKSGMNCGHMQWLGTKDGVNDDVVTEDKLSNTILDSISTDESRDGQYIPQMYCKTRGILIDEEIVEKINKASAMDSQAVEVIEEIEMDNGEVDVRVGYRYPSKGEIVMDGVIRKVAGLRAEGTKSICDTCPFYCKSEFKSDSEFNNEVVEARETLGNNKAKLGEDIFISRRKREFLSAKAQAVQTLTRKGWVTDFPGNTEDAIDFRIKGLGGITVVSSESMKDALPELGALSHVGEVEEFDKGKALFEASLQSIFTAARNFANLTQKEANDAFALAMAKPEGLTESQSKRWDNAVNWLRQSVIWAQERTAYRNRPDFMQKFFAEKKGLEYNVVTDEIIVTAQERDKHGELSYGLGYRDVDFKDMVKHLEESVALDAIFHVIVTGEEISVVAGDISLENEADLEEGVRTDAELVAGALQHMLNVQVSGLLYGVRRSEDPKAAIADLKVHEDVKAYIAHVLNIKA